MTNMRVVKATSVSEHGNFFMEILDGTKTIEKISLVSKTEGAIKSWTLDDSLVVKKENNDEVVFRIHGNKGPVYLVTEKIENGKSKKFRVTFYTDGEQIPKQASTKTISSNKTNVIDHKEKVDNINPKVKVIGVNRSGKPTDNGFEMTDGYMPEYTKQSSHGPDEWLVWYNNYVKTH